jgi:hypothetical protein
MKKIQVILSSLIAASAMLLPVAVRAETTAPNTTTTTTTETITQRVGKYKQSLKNQPTAAEQAKIKLNCKAAQVNVSITNNLKTLVTDLKASNVDTAALETQRDALQKLITTYGTDLKTYQENIADMNAIDCVTDPVGFKAALEAARSSQAIVLKDIKAIRTYVNDTIKPTLVDLKNNNANGSAQ